jgi:apolipoprotein D and lipocalin family protein
MTIFSTPWHGRWPRGPRLGAAAAPCNGQRRRNIRWVLAKVPPMMLRLAPLLLLLAACSAPDPNPVRSVAAVDLGRYAGLWYEVARFPNRFEDGRELDCADVTATYAGTGEGRISVVNRCRNAAAGGREIEARGSAYAVAGSGNSRLRVSFFWPFYGDYWVLGLAPDYSWAVVGDPDRDYLWVLARTPRLDEASYAAAVASAAAQGFAVGRLKRTAHSAAR